MLRGGLTDEELDAIRAFTDLARETPTYKTHNYAIVNSSTGQTMSHVANNWASRGWRVVGVVSDTRPGYSHAFVLERPVEITHPDD